MICHLLRSRQPVLRFLIFEFIFVISVISLGSKWVMFGDKRWSVFPSFFSGQTIAKEGNLSSQVKLISCCIHRNQEDSYCGTPPPGYNSPDWFWCNHRCPRSISTQGRSSTSDPKSSRWIPRSWLRICCSCSCCRSRFGRLWSQVQTIAEIQYHNPPKHSTVYLKIWDWIELLMISMCFLCGGDFIFFPQKSSSWALSYFVHQPEFFCFFDK